MINSHFQAMQIPFPVEQYFVTGQHRVRFLQNFCTNDVARLTPNTGVEVFFPNVKGRIVGHGWIHALEDSLVMTIGAGTGTSLLPHLERYIITEDVTFTKAALKDTWLVGGETANQLWAEISQQQRDLAAESVHQMIAGVGWRAALMTGWSLPVMAVFMDEHAAHEELSTLASLAAIRKGTLLDFDRFRASVGMGWMGVDYSDAQLAQESGRTAVAISFHKGCYLGQEPIARLDAMGHTNKELVRLSTEVSLSDQDKSSWAGAELFADAEPKSVGVITTFCPHDDQPGGVGLGYVRTKWQVENQMLHVGTPEGPTITVHVPLIPANEPV